MLNDFLLHLKNRDESRKNCNKYTVQAQFKVVAKVILAGVRLLYIICSNCKKMYLENRKNAF